MLTKPGWRFIWSRPEYALAFGFGAGLSPIAPGTVGTLVGYPLYLLLAACLPPPGILAALAVLFALGCWWCDLTGKALGIADHRGIVWDEIVAMALVLCLVPPTAIAWLLGFIAFRFFDIVKPWPIYSVDAYMENGLGVMLDDLLAALYAIAVVDLVCAW